MSKFFKNILTGFLISTLLFSIIGVNIKHHVCEITGEHEVYLLESDCTCNGSCEAEHHNENFDKHCSIEHKYECCKDVSDLVSLDFETIISNPDLKFKPSTKSIKKVRLDISVKKEEKNTKNRYCTPKPLNSEQDKIIKLITQKISTQSDDDLIG